MNKTEFWGYYLANIELSLVYGLVIILFNTLVFKRYIYSIFDPLLLHVVMSSFGFSVVFILFHLNLIHMDFFMSFVFTQLAFIFGFVLFKPISITNSLSCSNAPNLYFNGSMTFLYYLSVMLFVVSQLIVYKSKGIPLFMDSRLETFNGGGGFGVFNRIIPVTSLISLTIALQKVYFSPTRNVCKQFFNKSVLLFVLIVAFLSGSKSAFLDIVFVSSFIILFNYKINNASTRKTMLSLRAVQWKFLMLAILAAILVVVVQAVTRGEAGINPVIHIAMRMVNTGDVYMYAYPNSFINNMDAAPAFSALFKDFLGMTRLVPWSELPQHIGLQLYQSMYSTEDIMGPNARHNIFGLFYFGYWYSIIFSFILGMVISYVRNRLYFRVSNSAVGLVIYVLLAKSILGFEVDPPYSVSVFMSIFLVFPILYFISYIVANAIKKVHV